MLLSSATVSLVLWKGIASPFLYPHIVNGSNYACGQPCPQSKYRTRAETVRGPCTMSSGEAAQRDITCDNITLPPSDECRQKATDVRGRLHTG
jgi:hypothetical protein